MSPVLDSYMIPKDFEKVYWRGEDKVGFIHPDSYAEILAATFPTQLGVLTRFCGVELIPDWNVPKGKIWPPK
jgi:hypothetical protein